MVRISLISLFLAFLIALIFPKFSGVVFADYCGPDPSNPSVRVDRIVSIYCDAFNGCQEQRDPAHVEYCSVGSCSVTYQEPYCTYGIGGPCNQSFRPHTAYCWVGGGPTPTPTPTPPAGCGTCNENNCSNTCSGTACGTCSNGGAYCAWGSKSCGGPGPTPTPTPSCTLPVAPTLLTPSDNANIIGTTASLSWRETVADWGNCPGNLKSFRVFVDAGACTFFSSPSNIFDNTTATSDTFTGISGQSYCWSVVARKSATVISPKARPPRTFTLCANTAPTFTSTTETVTGTSASLSWVLRDWGNNCASYAYQYQVYVDGSLVYTLPTSSLTALHTYTGPAGPHSWYVVASNGAANVTSPTRPFTLAAPSSAWFQVDGDVVAFNGNITSPAEDNDFQISPQAAIISSSSISVGSQNGLLKIPDTTLSNSVTANNSYAKFYTRITNRLTPDPYSGDFSCTEKTVNGDTACYLYSSGAVTIDTAQTITKKIVLLVDGDVNINQNISINPGGLLVLLSEGNITLDGTVTSLQGIYLADKIFNTGTSTDTTLTVNGTVVGLGGVSFNRNVPSSTTPAEKFVFNPDYYSAIPTALYEQSRQWQEFSP